MLRRLALLCATSSLVLVSGGTQAASLLDYQPAASLYLGVGFGGSARARSDALSYGFRLDYASVRADRALPGLLDVNLQGSGLATVRLGGVQLVQATTILGQSADPSTAPAEPSGKSVGEQIGSVFEGIGLGTGAVILAGGVAVAVIVASGGGGDHGSGDKGVGPTSTSTDCSGGRIDVIGTCSAVCTDITTVCGHAFVGGESTRYRTEDYDRLRWLDSGTGQMGDLLPR